MKSYDLSKKIPNMQKRFEIDKGSIYYVGYLSGDYLDEAINTERSEFVFPDPPMAETGDRANEDEIVEATVELIKNYIHEDLQRIEDEKKEQIDRFVHSTRPQYRFLLNKCPEVYDLIPNGLSNEKLDIELYKHQQNWEYRTDQKKQDIDNRIKNNATTDIGFS